MISPDFVNGLFELLGAVFIYQSIRKLRHDKLVRGVSWLHVSFFAVWGAWNVFFYPFYGLWMSFAGGVFILITNTYYVGQLLYYTRLEKNAKKNYQGRVNQEDTC